jgi:hypothetical protein
MTKVNFENLNKVPYMRNFSDNPKFQELVDEYINVWSQQSDIGLDGVALIRAVECTNGCVQYAFRDGESWALDLEQTRLCMKTSMTFIKNKSLKLKNGEEIKIDNSVHHLLDEVRDIYIDGFKNNMPERLMQFYAQSVAQFYVLGKERLERQLNFVREELGDVFGEEFLTRGRNYIFSYLNALE